VLDVCLRLRRTIASLGRDAVVDLVDLLDGLDPNGLTV
jgi:hypothetical protein